jgi:hypothetical protein
MNTRQGCFFLPQKPIHKRGSGKITPLKIQKKTTFRPLVQNFLILAILGVFEG